MGGIQCETDSLYFIDSDSRFGSFINGHRVTGSVLCTDGDAFSFGVAPDSFRYYLNPVAMHIFS